MLGCYHQLTEASHSPRRDVWDISPLECERGGPRANKALDGNKATLSGPLPLSFNHPLVPSSIALSLYPGSAFPPGPDLLLAQVCRLLLTQRPPTPLANPRATGAPGLRHPAVETRGPVWGLRGSRPPGSASSTEPRSPAHVI